MKQLQGDNYKLVVKVFIRTAKSMKQKVNLNFFVNCQTSETPDPKFKSKDLDNYSDKYDLNYLLENFSKPEVLDPNNSWFCSKCKAHVRATKKIEIYKLPKYLIIHLKKLKLYSKQIPLITFPLENLDMSRYAINTDSVRSYHAEPEEFYKPEDLDYYKSKKKSHILNHDEEMINKARYNLYGVVNHSGSQHFGHYTSFCKADDGKWYSFNDSMVNKISSKDVVGDDAYMLFYKRIN